MRHLERSTTSLAGILLAFSCIVLAAPVSAGALRDTLNQAVRRTFGEASTWQTFSVTCDAACRSTITVGRPAAKRSLIVVRAATTVAGYGIVDNVMGKERPITYLLLVDRSLRVKGLEILAYREIRGGEVRRRSWLDQFIGKGPDARLRVGDDIDAISGATISANGVSSGVRRLLKWLTHLSRQGVLPQ